MNLIMDDMLDTDSYKPSQWLQYPPGMSYMYSYFESRGGIFPAARWFGLQMTLMRNFRTRVTEEMVDRTATFLSAHGEPFNHKGWMYIAKEREGRLPIHIKSAPEGLVIPVRNVMMCVESTDEQVPWVPGWFETPLSRVWYPTTVCTVSFEAKKTIKAALEKTCENAKAELPFKLHDFGSRGVSSRESAMFGGAAHLMNFMGSDTLAGVWAMNNYYSSGMSGFSIPATEHSTITSWGREGEFEAYKHFIKTYPGRLIACVSDSYDIRKAIRFWATLKDTLIETNTTLVIRFDSGDPIEMVSEGMALVAECFGYTTNKLGYKVLHPCVRTLQGDGIHLKEIGQILDRLIDEKFSAENIAFGMGGGLLQKVNRDTLKFAYKCSSITVDGQERDVYKDPITDPGKKSKTGRLKLIVDEKGQYQTTRRTDNDLPDVMETVFKDGEITASNILREMMDRCKV